MCGLTIAGQFFSEILQLSTEPDTQAMTFTLIQSRNHINSFIHTNSDRAHTQHTVLSMYTGVITYFNLIKHIQTQIFTYTYNNTMS